VHELFEEQVEWTILTSPYWSCAGGRTQPWTQMAGPKVIRELSANG
jgi:hypothetical protein